MARKHSYSLSEEPRTGIVSRLETQQGTIATHKLESQGQTLSAYNTARHYSHLTFWRVKEKHC